MLSTFLLVAFVSFTFAVENEVAEQNKDFCEKLDETCQTCFVSMIDCVSSKLKSVDGYNEIEAKCTKTNPNNEMMQGECVAEQVNNKCPFSE